MVLIVSAIYHGKFKLPPLSAIKLCKIKPVEKSSPRGSTVRAMKCVSDSTVRATEVEEATAMPPLALWTAASLGEVEEVRRLLAEGADIQEKGGRMRSSPLHAAVWCGHVQVSAPVEQQPRALNVVMLDGGPAD
jgi:hypothetical protein